MSDRPPVFLDGPEYSACIILQLGETGRGWGGQGGPCREILDDITLMSGISKTAKIDFTATLSATDGRSRFRRENPLAELFHRARGAPSSASVASTEPDILITDVTRVISDIEFAQLSDGSAAL